MGKNRKLYYRISSNKRLLEGGAYFEVRELKNIECQSLAILSFKIRMKHKFSLSISRNMLKKSKYIFIVLLFPY